MHTDCVPTDTNGGFPPGPDPNVCLSSALLSVPRSLVTSDVDNWRLGVSVPTPTPTPTPTEFPVTGGLLTWYLLDLKRLGRSDPVEFPR